MAEKKWKEVEEKEEQNSTSWLIRRRKGIGSSDTPIILNLSPWKTPYQLWLDKIGESLPTEPNFAQQRGISLEPVVRKEVERVLQKSFPPKFIHSLTHPHMLANLDGFSDDGTIIEIKCPGQSTHNLAKNGKIPDHYRVQILHQMIVADTTMAIYVSYFEGDLVMIPVARNEGLEANIIKETKYFWDLVLHKTPPDLTARDKKEIHDIEAIKLANKYDDIEKAIKDLEEEKKRLREELDKYITHPKVQIGSLSIQKVFYRGQVDYNLIPELKDIDLEQYRKPGGFRTTFKRS